MKTALRGKMEPEFSRARQLKGTGDLAEAALIFQMLNTDYPGEPLIIGGGLKASLCQLKKDRKDSAKLFTANNSTFA